VVPAPPALLQVARTPIEQHVCHVCDTVLIDASKEPHGPGDHRSANDYIPIIHLERVASILVVPAPPALLQVAAGARSMIFLG